MIKNSLLLFMILCYAIPIMIVYYNYHGNTSVSNIISDKKHKYYILFFMMLMGIGTIMYELERRDVYSLRLIFILLIGIYGVVSVDEIVYTGPHYFFAFLAFSSILLFMFRHCYLHLCNNILYSSLLLAISILFYIILNIKQPIYMSEVMYILNFAFFYLYLHFSQ